MYKLNTIIQSLSYLTLIVLGLAGGSIYMLPYIKYIFYNPIMNVMGINNAQSGMLLSMYAIGNVVLYIPGGMLADRVSSRKAITISLLATTVLTVIFAVTFDYYVAMILWLLLSFGSGFVFWAAILKTIRIIGTEEEQGRMYGVYYAANGGFSALIGAVCLKAFSSAADERTGLFGAIMVMALFTLVTVIPEKATGYIYMRASTIKKLNALAKRVQNCANGAAIATENTYATTQLYPSYAELFIGEDAKQIVCSVMDELDMNWKEQTNPSGSSDIGNVDLVIPVFHPMISIGNSEVSLYSKEFADEISGEGGRTGLENGAKVIARIIEKLAFEPNLLKKVQEEHAIYRQL